MIHEIVAIFCGGILALIEIQYGRLAFELIPLMMIISFIILKWEEPSESTKGANK